MIVLGLAVIALGLFVAFNILGSADSMAGFSRPFSSGRFFGVELVVVGIVFVVIGVRS